MEEKTMYVVTRDGYYLGYGSKIYLVGVFDNEEDAKNAGGAITKIPLNKAFPLKPDESTRRFNYGLEQYEDYCDEECNEFYLGGYCE